MPPSRACGHTLVASRPAALRVAVSLHEYSTALPLRPSPGRNRCYRGRCRMQPLSVDERARGPGRHRASRPSLLAFDRVERAPPGGSARNTEPPLRSSSHPRGTPCAYTRLSVLCARPPTDAPSAQHGGPAQRRSAGLRLLPHRCCCPMRRYSVASAT
eukprot:COSAG02_NODE_676_length_18610_cov_44.695532_2_plen_158_part_00